MMKKKQQGEINRVLIKKNPFSPQEFLDQERSDKQTDQHIHRGPGNSNGKGSKIINQ